MTDSKLASARTLLAANLARTWPRIWAFPSPRYIAGCQRLIGLSVL